MELTPRRSRQRLPSGQRRYQVGAIATPNDAPPQNVPEEIVMGETQSNAAAKEESAKAEPKRDYSPSGPSIFGAWVVTLDFTHPTIPVRM